MAAVVIYCTKCRARRQADRCTMFERSNGRQVRVWGNRCLTCGTAHRTIAPGSGDQRPARRVGQLSLFGGKGRA